MQGYAGSNDRVDFISCLEMCIPFFQTMTGRSPPQRAIRFNVEDTLFIALRYLCFDPRTAQNTYLFQGFITTSNKPRHRLQAWHLYSHAEYGTILIGDVVSFARDHVIVQAACIPRTGDHFPLMIVVKITSIQLSKKMARKRLFSIHMLPTFNEEESCAVSSRSNMGESEGRNGPLPAPKEKWE